ncbi:neutral zinc metallopeptidase [Haloechinothrix sp. LS1_15]|uniref:neutral zinc metallopeptidase n=1 Tax=Haloechinothrix sp. LS1_15 TaxID=2652248 RepID=UPI00294548C8|nr:neutral zinc metallopeptidase [Haloechinothrix sp. LS1_15]MDV6013540.1 aminopeptidase [Haloechinothrix sp. LS1_15]
MTGRRRQRAVRVLALLAVAAVALTACGDEPTAGEAITEGDIAGLPVTHFPSGLADDAPEPEIDVDNVTDSEADGLATAASEDLTRYWSDALPAYFRTVFEPVERLLSYDPDTDDFTVCGQSVRGEVNAFYCPAADTLGWDRESLFPLLHDQFGPMGIVTVMAHEYGHAVQHRIAERAGISANTPTIVKELQADCFAGNYFRWLAEGSSDFFELSTSEGVNQALSALHFVRDAPGDLRHDIAAHGTGFDRTYAFQLGFEKDPTSCADIDEHTVDERSTQFAFSEQDTRRGDVPITAETIELATESLDAAFADTAAARPRVVISEDGSCPDGSGTPPASYCPDTNTVSIELSGLAALGEPIDQRAAWSGEPIAGFGDFAAFAVLASRYAMGLQRANGQSLHETGAGLRAACYVGSWAAFATEPRADDRILRLSPGDLDEAILEMLQPESLIAANVEGVPAPAGFTRVEALRVGFTEGAGSCPATFE